MGQKENLENKENFTEAEAAKWLTISKATLQRARYRGEISYYLLGNNRIVYGDNHLIDYRSRCERRNDDLSGDGKSDQNS